jgi:hypothetical protein
VAIECAPGLLDDAHALRHHHQAGRHRDDSHGRERLWLADQVRPGERQESAQAIVEDEHSILAFHFDPASPFIDLAPQVPGTRELDQAALLHAAPERQQRRIDAQTAGEQ